MPTVLDDSQPCVLPWLCTVSEDRKLKACFLFHRRVIEEYVRQGHEQENHAWVTKHTNHFVAHHMGWLMVARQMGLVARVRRGSYAFVCGCDGQKYRFLPFSKSRVLKYAELSRVVTDVLAVSPVQSFDVFTRLASKHGYHHLWLVRALVYAERVAAKCRPIEIPRGLSCNEYQKNLPDCNAYLKFLAKDGKHEVRSLVNKFFSKGRDALLFSMDTCFAGYLRKLDRAALVALDDARISKAREECKHPDLKLEGHPFVILQVALSSTKG